MTIVCIYFMLFIAYSLLGWVMEVLDIYYEKGKFINRGFLIGPICPIYGYGALTMIILLTRYKSNPILLFMMSMIIFSIIEYFTSYFMEKIFKARWWDYSHKKYNLNGRICLGTMMIFGLLGSFSMYIINPFLFNIISSLSNPLLYTLSIIFLLMYLTDNIISFYILFKYKVTFNIIKKDATEEITNKVRKIFLSKGILYKRLINAFPSLKLPKKYLKKQEKRINKIKTSKKVS